MLCSLDWIKSFASSLVISERPSPPIAVAIHPETSSQTEALRPCTSLSWWYDALSCNLQPYYNELGMIELHVAIVNHL